MQCTGVNSAYAVRPTLCATAGPGGAIYVACAKTPGDDPRFWVYRLDDNGSIRQRVSVGGEISSSARILLARPTCPRLCAHTVPCRAHRPVLHATHILHHTFYLTPSAYAPVRPPLTDCNRGTGGVPWSLEIGPDGSLFVTLHWGTEGAEEDGEGSGEGDEDMEDYVVPTLKPVLGERALPLPTIAVLGAATAMHHAPLTASPPAPHADIELNPPSACRLSEVLVKTLLPAPHTH